MIKNHLTFLLVFILFSNTSQSFAVESPKTPQLSIEVINHKEAGITFYRKRDFQSAQKAFQNCVKESQNQKDWLSKGQCLNNLGGVSYQLGKYTEGINFYKSAIEVYRSHSYDTLLGESYINLGLAYKKHDVYDSAISYYYRGIAILDSLDVTYSSMRGYNLLANALKDSKNFNESKKWYHKSLIIANDLNDAKQRAKVLNNLGSLYSIRQQYDSAIKYFKNSLRIKLQTPKNNSLGNTYFNLGELYFKTQQLDSATHYASLSIIQWKEYKDDFGLANSNLLMINIHLALNQIKKAEDLIKNTQATVKTVESENLQLELLKAQKSLAIFKKEYQKALNLEQDIKKVNERIWSIENQALIISYQVKYGVKTLEKTITNQGITIKSISQNLKIIAFVLFLLLVIIIFVFRDRQLKTNAKKVIETNFKDMHHRIKNNLTLVSGVITFKRRNIAEDYAKKVLKEIGLQLDAINLIHKKLYLENEEQLTKINISEYLEELIENVITSSGIIKEDVHVTYQMVEGQELSVDKANPIGLITNEVITNSIKHGMSNDGKWRISISMLREADSLVMTIKDQGKGFDIEKGTEKSGGKGLINLLSSQIGGQFSFKKDNGTLFQIRFKV